MHPAIVQGFVPDITRPEHTLPCAGTRNSVSVKGLPFGNVTTQAVSEYHCTSCPAFKLMLTGSGLAFGICILTPTQTVAGIAAAVAIIHLVYRISESFLTARTHFLTAVAGLRLQGSSPAAVVEMVDGNADCRSWDGYE